jgi:Tetracyclin repressor-like, C-terminal domain
VTPLVGFEGLPAEFSQHDFGEVVVRYPGLAYALKTPRLRAQVHDITKNSYEFATEWLRAFGESELPMPADVLVRVIHALIEGLVWQRILTPELCPDECSTQHSRRWRPKEGNGAIPCLTA